MNYHDIKAVHSTLILAALKSELHAYDTFTRKTEQTESMLKGSYIHALALNDGSVANFAVAPQVDRRTKDGKAAYEDFIRSIGNKTVISADTAEESASITAAIRASEPASRLIEGATVEKQITFQIEGTPCKAKLDIINGTTIADLKTISEDLSDHNLTRLIWNRNYHTQLAFYATAYEAEYNKMPEKFKIIFASTTAPYLVRVVELGMEWITLGLQRCDSAFPIAKKIIEGYVPTQPTDETKLEVPNYN